MASTNIEANVLGETVVRYNIPPKIKTRSKCAGKEVTIFPAATEEMKWFRIENCPLLDGEADISFKERKIIFRNRTMQQLLVNGTLVMPGAAIETEV